MKHLSNAVMAAAWIGGVALTFAPSEASAKSITVRVNGSSVPFRDTQPQRIEGRVLVPLRGVLEEIGADVHWNEATQTVKASLNRRTIELPLGSRTATINGAPVGLRVPAQRIGGSTMVPLRFLGEALGASVDWDEPSQQVDIYVDPDAEPSPEYRGRNRWRDRESGFRLMVNGGEERFGVARPYLSDGVVMVPLEQMSRLTNFSYRYDDGEREVRVPERRLFHTVGSRSVEADGRRIALDGASEIRGGVLYVPLRFIEVASDRDADWNASTHTITISGRR